MGIAVDACLRGVKASLNAYYFNIDRDLFFLGGGDDATPSE